MPPLNTFSRTCLSLAISQALLVPANAATIEVNDNGDTDPAAACTLRQAIVSANTNMVAPTSNCVAGTAGADTITFANSVVAGGSISLTQPSDLLITQDLTISGPVLFETSPLQIHGMGNDRVFYINGATVNLDRLLISGGSINGYGGGIGANLSTVNISNSWVAGNSATGSGGGIFAFSSSISISESTVLFNSAQVNGGGIAAFSNSSVSLSNSTLSQNSAGTLHGGGIYALTGEVNITNSTLSGNSAYSAGGGVRVQSSSLTIRNTIVAGNVAPTGSEISDVSNLHTTANNLLGDNSRSSAQSFSGFTPNISNDITATNDGTQATSLYSIISPITDYLSEGTLTHVLIDGSPALNAGDGTICTAAPINSVDQRGLPRNTVCDIGASEAQTTATITVASVADGTGSDCTLRDAIHSSNSNSAIGGCMAGNNNNEIVFDSDVFPLLEANTITLSSSLPALTSNASISGRGTSGLTIDANNMGRVIEISNANVSLNSLTITGGAAYNGGGIHVNSRGSLSLNGSSVSGNSAQGYGGGIFAFGLSRVSIANSTVSGNSAGNYGGGVYGATSSVSVANSTVSSNSSQGHGGGVFVISSSSRLNLINSTVTGNSALLSGGGIFTQDSILGLSNTIVAGNTAGTSGSEIIRNAGSYVTSNNLLGDDSRLNAQSFIGFTPNVSNDITATFDGTQATNLAAILTPLADNGGTTLTHALYVGSPALNAGDGTICTTSPVSSVDQRGLPRNTVCDIGAFEAQTTATITVASTADGTGSDCTLRDAINSSNSNSAIGGCTAGNNNNEIVFDSSIFPPSAVNTITLSSSLPRITSDMTIAGQGASGLTIDANNTGRVFEIRNATVSLNSLTITGGSASNAGGGIHTRYSSISIANCNVSNNSGEGISAYHGNVSVTDSTVSNNSGSGVWTYSSNVNVSNSTISSNSEEGLYFRNGSNVSVVNSTVSYHSGSGVWTYSSNVNVSNSTVHANSSSGFKILSSSISIINSTVSENSNSNRGGGINANSSSIRLSNSIIAGNLAPIDAEIGDDSASSFTTDHNVLGDSSYNSAGAFFAGFSPDSTDIIATSDGTLSTALSSILRPLTDNGGVTQTQALVVGSPAVDMGNYATCLATPVNTLDQRGRTRALGGVCDIGSFEFIPSSTISVNDTADTPGTTDCSLRDAIESANTRNAIGGCVAGADVETEIVFNPAEFPLSVSRTITLGSSLPAITSDMTITGQGASELIIDANNTGQIFDIHNATVGLSGLTITGGMAINGGGVSVVSGGDVNLGDVKISGNVAANKGGGVFVDSSSSLNLNNSTVSDNSAIDGGGVSVVSGGDVNLGDVKISGNVATNKGGGVFVDSNSSLDINNSTVSENSAFNGAGIFNYGSINIRNSTLKLNSASNGGGGIYALVGITSLSNSTVSGNLGHGIWERAGSFTLTNSTISGNSSVGIFAYSTSLSIRNSIIAGNAGVPAEIFDFNGDSTFTTKSNLLGDSNSTNATAFSASFTPDATDITATSNGTQPTSLSSILAPLADSGGVTQTHALIEGSPAIDAGDSVICSAFPISNFDQRGEVRPDGDDCDIGSYEGSVEKESSFFVVPLPGGKVVVFSL